MENKKKFQKKKKKNKKIEKEEEELYKKTLNEINILNNHIKELGKLFGLSDLELNYQNECSIIFDKLIKVEIVYNEILNKATILFPICQIPKK